MKSKLYDNCQQFRLKQRQLNNSCHGNKYTTKTTLHLISPLKYTSGLNTGDTEHITDK